MRVQNMGKTKEVNKEKENKPKNKAESLKHLAQTLQWTYVLLYFTLKIYGEIEEILMAVIEFFLNI